MSLAQFLMLWLCIMCLPPTLWALCAIKLLRDKKLFFYFRVTISLNNAKTQGGVAEGLQRVGTPSWIKLYIVSAAGEACSSSKCFVSLSHPITFGKQLWKQSWPKIKREIGPGEISTHQAKECSADRTAKGRFPVVCGSRALSAELSEVEVTLNLYILQERKVSVAECMTVSLKCSLGSLRWESSVALLEHFTISS